SYSLVLMPCTVTSFFSLHPTTRYLSTLSLHDALPIFSGSAHQIPRFLRNLRVTSSKRASKHETTHTSARYPSVCESKWKTFFTALTGAARFDFIQQLLDLVLLLQSRQPVLDAVANHLGFR